MWTASGAVGVLFALVLVPWIGHLLDSTRSVLLRAPAPLTVWDAGQATPLVHFVVVTLLFGAAYWLHIRALPGWHGFVAAFATAGGLALAAIGLGEPGFATRWPLLVLAGVIFGLLASFALVLPSFVVGVALKRPTHASVALVWGVLGLLAIAVGLVSLPILDEKTPGFAAPVRSGKVCIAVGAMLLAMALGRVARLRHLLIQARRGTARGWKIIDSNDDTLEDLAALFRTKLFRPTGILVRLRMPPPKGSYRTSRPQQEPVALIDMGDRS